MAETLQDAVAQALRVLGKDRLVLAVHDASYPSLPSEDTGRGTPYSQGSLVFLRWIRSLGFNGLQFGPQGQTSRTNPSPYDGTLFARNFLSIDLATLAHKDNEWAGLLPADVLRQVVDNKPAHAADRVPYEYAYETQQNALLVAYDRFLERQDRHTYETPATLTVPVSGGGAGMKSLFSAYDAFIEEEKPWLRAEEMFAALTQEHGTDDWRQWSPHPLDAVLFEGLTAAYPSTAPETKPPIQRRRRDLRARHRHAVGFVRFVQFVLHRQHQMLRQQARAMQIKMYGDLQIGISWQDEWILQDLLLPGYFLGAPPSRTNPAGQPWNYPVLHPGLYYTWHETDGGYRWPSYGPVLRLFAARIHQLLANFDGLRIDHPHGIVCPWVYQAHQQDPYLAVQQGARLFSSPLRLRPDHPRLRDFAITTAEQCNPHLPAHDDNYVSFLTSEQIQRYSAVFDVIMATVAKEGHQTTDILCEVLSTQPYPLQRVMAKYGLGRFRVTQKANPLQPGDVYRSEQARPSDWIMVGNHDTPPLWTVVQRWQREGTHTDHAAYLAERLVPEESARNDFARYLASDPAEMAQAKFAELFASRARHVMVFFSDLFGIQEIYNRPGEVHPDNWTLRIPSDYVTSYAEKLRHNQALNLPQALAMALRARGLEVAYRPLLTALEAYARQLRQGMVPPVSS